MWDAVGLGRPACPPRRLTETRSAALVSRSASHELRRRLGLQRTFSDRTSQPGGLLWKLYPGLRLLPELALSPYATHGRSHRHHRSDDIRGTRELCQYEYCLHLFLWGRSRQPDASRTCHCIYISPARRDDLLGDCRDNGSASAEESHRAFSWHGRVREV